MEYIVHGSKNQIDSSFFSLQSKWKNYYQDLTRLPSKEHPRWQYTRKLELIESLLIYLHYNLS